VSAISHAVFLSYASHDAEAAKRICDALRAAGIEVWFDQSELRGGDVWDRQIRQQIHDCRLFMPIVSANAEARVEGYFRREWKLAVDRTHDLSERVAFLVPIVIDSTPEAKADVPDAFRHVQWTRLPGGIASSAFVERIRGLITPVPSSALPTATAPPEYRSAQISATTNGPHRVARVALWAVSGVVALGLAYFVADRFWLSKHGTGVVAKPADDSASKGGSPAATVATFNPPPHSVAVLPFINMSGDKEQEYFSEGLTEELLNSLAEINGLQVAARTSAFSFQGKDIDLGTIAHRLNVGAILEGSVRRSGHTVRITAQLINAVTGFHLWSKTYDRDLGDVLQLQTEIATAVAEALKVTLLGDVSAKIELGGTRNPAAFDAYLRGLKLARTATTREECRAPIDAFTEAIRLDSDYALAYASRSLIVWECASHYSGDWIHPGIDAGVRTDAQRAIALAPTLAEGHVALSSLESGRLEFAAADAACARALAVAPNNDRALYECGRLAGWLGHVDAGIAAARRGVALDPLNPLSHRALGDTLRAAHRYQEAIAAYQDSIAMDPEHSAEAYARRGLSYFLSGDLTQAQSSCEAKPDYYESWVCQAVIYHRLGRHDAAAAALARLVHRAGDSTAYQYVQIHAQWGERAAALEWLEKARRLGDPGLIYLKTDPLIDPLRNEPRFQEVMRELNFPPQ
jgi:TolB-like protein/tetratricopeptide (TPR) repeat protein